MTKMKDLEKRLDRITTGGDVWIPPWLQAVGSVEEIAEWKAILKTRRREEQTERRLEFQRKMREKHPDMPLTFEEEMEAGRKRLRKNPELRRREGLDPIESHVEDAERS